MRLAESKEAFICLSTSFLLNVCVGELSKEHISELSDLFSLCALVSNIAGRLSSTNTGSLLPTFSYFYCFLSLSSAHCTDRGKRLFLPASSTLHPPLTLASMLQQETAGIN